MRSFGDVEVLRAAAVRARAGRVTVLLGRNGSGKSTLLRCALGLRPAENGSVIWRGRATLRPRLARMAREGLFFLPDRDLAVPGRRVATHLERLRAAFPGAASPAGMDPLHVASLADARVHTLSGGERRRVELTLAVLRNPVCIIADEPLTGLEPAYQKRAIGSLADAARRGAAVLVTGHEVELLLAIADEVVWIVAGGTYVLGTPEEAWAHPEFARQYLGRRAASHAPPAAASSAPVRVPDANVQGARVGFRRSAMIRLRRGAAVCLPVAASAAVTWTAVRVLLAASRRAVPVSAGNEATGSMLPGEMSPAVVAACVFLTWVYGRRRRDASWLANLGLGGRGKLLLWTGTCLGLEFLATLTSVRWLP